MRILVISLICVLALPLSGVAQDSEGWEAGISDNACYARIFLGKRGDFAADANVSPGLYLGFLVLHPGAVDPYEDLIQVKPGDMLIQVQVVPSWNFEAESPRTLSEMRVALGSEEFPLLLIPSDSRETFHKAVIAGAVAERVWSAIGKGLHPEIRFRFEKKSISIPIQGSRAEAAAAMLAACVRTMKLKN